MIKSQHSRVFEQLVAEARVKLIDAMITGGQEDSYLHEIIGAIRGLDDALRLSEEADFKLSGDE